MFKKHISLVVSSLVLAAGLMTGCSNAFDVAAGGSVDAAGARAASDTGKRIYVKVDDFSSSNDRVQFKLNSLKKESGSSKSVSSGKEVKFNIMFNDYDAMPSDTTITVRDGSSESKWSTVNFKDLSMSEGWYTVSVKAKSSTSKLGFTVNGKKFKSGDVIAIKNITVDGTTLYYKTTDWSRWSQPSSLSFSLTALESNETPDPVPPDPIPEPEPKPEPKPIETPIKGSNITHVGLRFSKSGVTKDEVTGEKNLSKPTVSEWKKYLTEFKAMAPANVDPVLIFIVNSISKTDESSSYSDKCSFRFSKPDNIESKISSFLSENSSALKNYYNKNPELAKLTKSKIDMSHMSFSSSENSYCDELLQMCLDNGIKVWLQIQPGDNDPVVLEYIVLERFKKYKDTVLGLGVDCEWFRQIYKKSTHGCPLRDESGSNDYIAKALVEMARKFNPNYQVFAKHWETGYMPETFRDGMVFVDDTQDIKAKDGKTAWQRMVGKFGDWASAFPNNPVIFQIGYYRDYENIWKKKEIDLINDLAAEAKARGNNNVSLVWVDFTMRTFLKEVGIKK
ncbi:MAG: hypothetical protein J6Z17_00125 [Treponema sp.]|nr:hypothetical protein [Treponema sp.]